jgi:cysteine desulfurase
MGDTGSVYLDYAATTPLDERVLDAMLPYLRSSFGNASSQHAFGRAARMAVDDARAAVAECLGAQPSEIVFTGGGTESDHLALKGSARAARNGSAHLIVSSVEHHAVLRAADDLEGEGLRVTRVPVDGTGVVDLDALADAVGPDTAIVSVMLANNEVGTIEPIDEVVRIVKSRNPRSLVHTDAVQAVGLVGVDVESTGVDLLSLSAHKFYGPKGVGALFVRRGTALAPPQGGTQERGLRAGTEDVAGIVGLATALHLACADLDAKAARLRMLRDRVIAGVVGQVKDAMLTGHPTNRLPNSASFVVPGVAGETLVVALDQRGFAVSSGAACSSGSTEASHVLLAMGLGAELAGSGLRVTVGTATTAEEIDRFVRALADVIPELRALGLC